MLRRLLGQVIDFQYRGGQLWRVAQLLHGLRPRNGSVSRPKVLVLLPMVVVNMSRSDQGTQLPDCRGYAAPDMRMTQVETHAHIFEVADSHDLEQIDRLGHFVLEVF